MKCLCSIFFMLYCVSCLGWPSRSSFRFFFYCLNPELCFTGFVGGCFKRSVIVFFLIGLKSFPKFFVEFSGKLRGN